MHGLASKAPLSGPGVWANVGVLLCLEVLRRGQAWTLRRH